MSRRLLTPTQIDELVAKQGHLCAYCRLPFGAVIRHPGRAGQTIQSATGDHFVPHSYTSSDRKFVAACQVCNQIKNDTIFSDMSTARAYITQRRRAKGLVVIFIPETPITRDSTKWGREYAAWLSASLSPQDDD
jgi:hypothetical protein